LAGQLLLLVRLQTLLLEICADMGCCIIWVSIVVLLLGGAGWAWAFFLRRRALRYRAAFDRAFAVARRVYNFTDDETSELTEILGEPIERHRRQANR
jgi:hypothetical protein